MVKKNAFENVIGKAVTISFSCLNVLILSGVFIVQPPVAYFAKEVNTSLAKLLLEFWWFS